MTYHSPEQQKILRTQASILVETFSRMPVCATRNPTTTTRADGSNRASKLLTEETEPGDVNGTRSSFHQHPETSIRSKSEQFPASVAIPSGEGPKGKCGTASRVNPTFESDAWFLFPRGCQCIDDSGRCEFCQVRSHGAEAYSGVA
jgi:hypothetical protein